MGGRDGALYLCLHLQEALNVPAALGLRGQGLQEGLVGRVHVLPPEKVVETERGDG